MSLIDPVHDVAGMFTRNDQAEAAGVVRGVSLRISTERLALIDAMASYAETSRNVMVNQLLKAGISAVRDQLPAVINDEISSDAADRLEALEREG
jgi:hypothetical protein